MEIRVFDDFWIREKSATVSLKVKPGSFPASPGVPDCKIHSPGRAKEEDKRRR